MEITRIILSEIFFSKFIEKYTFYKFLWKASLTLDGVGSILVM